MPWLGVSVVVEGTPSPTPCVYVANHRTYMDIPVLAGVLGATFLSRADVATWAVIGTVARLTGVVFIERDDLHERMRATRRLVRQLRTGSVIVFAEGTTTGAAQPGPFHPGLFRLVQRLRVPIVPVSIRYSDRRAYWIEDLTVGQHLQNRILVGLPLRVAVHVGNALHPADYESAEALGAAVHAAVCEPIITCGELA